MSSKSNGKSELFVIGAGQMRTGTRSLKDALEILYPGMKCYHMHEMMFYQKHHINLWIEAFTSGKLTKEAADEIFQNYRLMTDFPASLFYNDLMEIYPNAKVVLTLRDRKGWLKSVKNTTFAVPEPNMLLKMFDILIGGFWYRFRKFKAQMEQYAYGKDMDYLLANEEYLLEAFDKLNNEVIKKVPADRLLIFNQGDGWEKLCPFLKLPIPSVDYPHVNTTKEFQSFVEGIYTKQNIISIGILTLMGSAVAVVYRFWIKQN